MRSAIIVSLLLAVSLLGACNRNKGNRFALENPNPNTSSAPVAPNPAVMPVASYADTVSKATPAVVTIHSEQRVRQPQQFPFMDDPFFRRFFGERNQQQAPSRPTRQGLGSGVIVREDGYILTNHHVIDGADKISVDMNDKRSLEAQVVGSDPPSDLAVLKVNASGLPVLPLGDSDRTRVGDVVLAIGNPLGVGQTVTMGIISAKGRQTGLSNGSFEDFLQTDAPINRGNSGGALVSTNGELIGINSQILSPSGGSIGLGFAIPSNMARNVMEQLINGGKVRRGQLGIVVLPIPSEEASRLGVTQGPGVVVYQVQSGSGADRAGLKQGDVITALNGQAVADPNSFRNAIASTPPGSEITLTVKRGGSEQQVRATLGEFHPEAERPRDQDDQ
ncbi:MAG TPA: Do family serine endopeptidase [Pyrinomonadaceae bacterium]|nr:Do family serine endopeptidase [Pyrinomonadaceae bacterium]